MVAITDRPWRAMFLTVRMTTRAECASRPVVGSSCMRSHHRLRLRLVRQLKRTGACGAGLTRKSTDGLATSSTPGQQAKTPSRSARDMSTRTASN